MKSIYLCMMILAGDVLADWENPSEKYVSEYKKHQYAECPIRSNNIQNFVYFARDRDKIKGHALLNNRRFSGAQIMYPWANLEIDKDSYDFSSIEEDLSYLNKYGKQLFIQLQDASFNPNYKAVPMYLLSNTYNGGASPQFTDNNEIEGWVAKRWNPLVQDRFRALLKALGNRFEGRIAGINLQETAIGISHETDPTFTNIKYVTSIKANMKALKDAFPETTKLQYANFMPGEWLPWEDEGYLKSIYQYGNQIGVGLAAPDLMVRRKGQLNHALAMMHENVFSVPLGIAVQDGNYIGQTNTMAIQDKRVNIVPLLYSFAANFLKVDYMFWVDQEPYFKQDVLTCFESEVDGI